MTFQDLLFLLSLCGLFALAVLFWKAFFAVAGFLNKLYTAVYGFADLHDSFWDRAQNTRHMLEMHDESIGRYKQHFEAHSKRIIDLERMLEKKNGKK